MSIGIDLRVRGSHTQSPLDLGDAACSKTTILLFAQLRERRVARFLLCSAVLEDLSMVWIETHQQSWLVKEHAVDLLECTSRSLNAKEVGDWDHAEADDAPDPEEVAANVVQSDGSDHDDDELSIN